MAGLHAFLEQRLGTRTADTIGSAWAQNGFFDEAQTRRNSIPLYAREMDEFLAINEHRFEDALRIADTVIPWTAIRRQLLICQHDDGGSAR